MSSRDLDGERRRRTLDELEGVKTPPPCFDSYLTGTCHRLRQKPIGEFTVEDLRIMIGQSFGLFFLIPLALDVLESHPLAEGDFFPGDLLLSVLRSDPSYWQGHAEHRRRVDVLLEAIEGVPEELEAALAEWRRWTT